MMHAESIVSATDKLVQKDLDSGEFVMLDLRDNTYYGLNPVGRRIWELIQQPVKVSQVRDSLLEEYDVDPDQCTQDLIALLNDLVNKGLAELQNAEAG